MKLPMSLVRWFVLLAFLALPWPASAEGLPEEDGDDRAEAPIIVGDGTAASCTETALRNALFVAASDPGSTIRFKCGRGPVTITLREAAGEIQDIGFVALIVPDQTTIDGGGLITLLGADLTAVFVDRDTTVVLENLSNISISSIPGLFPRVGAIVNAGTLTVKNSTVSGSNVSQRGGGIYNTGTLTIKNSTVSHNEADFGGGIINTSTLTIKDSAVSSNIGRLDCGGIVNGGGAVAIVDHSTVSHNLAEDSGGGICTFGTLTIKHSTISSNVTFGPGAIGGGIDNGGTLTIKDSAVSDNAGGVLGFGGGIYNDGTLTVKNSTVSGNSVGRDGGGLFNGGRLIIDDSEVSGNTAPFGGGIYNTGTLGITESDIIHNTARVDGGGIYTCCGGTLTLKRTSVTDNTPNDIVP